MKFSLLFIWLLNLLLLVTQYADATHIRAGEITISPIDCANRIYEIRIVGYTDTDSEVDFGAGEIRLGDGETLLLESTDFDRKRALGNGVVVTEFIITHRYSSAGEYTISFREFNRNAEVCNMSNSVQTPFYIETTFKILGCNSTPTLLNPPVEVGCTGVQFSHNPGTYDADRDSISYELVVPKQDRDLPVNNYQDPDVHNSGILGSVLTEDRTSPAFFRLDPITGTVIWNAPGIACEYNIAFKICEWRQINGQWINLSCTTRDMQIIIEECDNERPEMEVPPDTCVVAGTLLEDVIRASDPDGDSVIIQPFGGLFELENSPATYAPNPPIYQYPEAIVDFSWQTVCDHVSDRAYNANFKATDSHGSGAASLRVKHSSDAPALTTNETWQITVVGPPPENLALDPNSDNRSITLTWDSYFCQNADSIQVWRRIDSYDFTPEGCETGIPEGSGYELINTVPAETNIYEDAGLAPGANYCYRLVAIFPRPKGGISLASDEACLILEDDPAIITHATVKETSPTAGIVEVKWIPPLYLDEENYPPPYQYQVLRASGAPNTVPQSYQLITPEIITDTIYIDSALDTQTRQQFYQIITYDGNGTLLDTSAYASTPFTDPEALFEAIEVNWSADVPWSNQVLERPYHYIYRNYVDQNDTSRLVLIDSVNVLFDGFRYVDDGSFNSIDLSDSITYCYYVTTIGSYGNDSIPEPLINDSQISCARPNDSIPPCTPIITGQLENCEEILAASGDCSFTDFRNTLKWSEDSGEGCQPDIRFYRVYFSPDGRDRNYGVIAEVRDTFFIHEDLPSFKGCYRISAVDRSGNESALSQPICNDNCPYYELPNLFTPNGDQKNDIFRPYYDYPAIFSGDQVLEPDRCARFAESLIFKVYNRWGDLVYVYNSEENRESGIYINWDGRSNDGTVLSSGVYYYSAEVVFNVLPSNQPKRVIKGWVKLLR